MDLKKIQGRDAEKKVPKLVFALGGPGTCIKEHTTRLAKDLGFKRLAVGELLKEEVRIGGALGAKIKEFMEQGELVPDDFVIDAIKKVVGRHKDKNYLIEGFPKTVAQGISLENYIGECYLLLHLSASPEELVKNAIMKENLDQASEVPTEEIFQKIDVAQKIVEPVIDYYNYLLKVCEVDCTGSVEKIYEKVQRAILPHVYMVIGPRCGGKTTVSQYLSKRCDIKYLDFEEFASKREFRKIRRNPELLTQELINYLKTETRERLIVKDKIIMRVTTEKKESIY